MNEMELEFNSSPTCKDVPLRAEIPDRADVPIEKDSAELLCQFAALVCSTCF